MFFFNPAITINMMSFLTYLYVKFVKINSVADGRAKTQTDANTKAPREVWSMSG